MKCNLCGSTDNEIIFDWTRNERNNIMRCTSCGLVFMKNGTDKSIENFYRQDFRSAQNHEQHPEEHYHDPVTVKDADSQFKFITENFDIEGKTILEIGSASGRLLEKLRDAGAQAAGMELNKEYAEYCRSYNFTVCSKPIEKCGMNEKYDMVVSFHTIEHFVNPKQAIRAIYKALKPNGALIGEVPNNDEWRISLLNDYSAKRIHYNPYHYFYFNPSTISFMLERTGFRNIHVNTIERYNSIMQLQQAFQAMQKECDINDYLTQQVFGYKKTPDKDCRLHQNTEVEERFNTFFAEAVNSQLRGNCIRFIAHKQRARKQDGTWRRKRSDVGKTRKIYKPKNE